MADPSNSKMHPHSLSEAPPIIQVTSETPATAERQDPILATQESHRQKTAYATLETSYRAASALSIDTEAASEDQVTETEDKFSSHLGIVDDAHQKINDYCAAHPGVFNHAINVLESLPDLKSFDSTFVEVSKVLVDGVTLLGELHPFVKVVVSPLRLILTFDLTRRQNNKKVTAVKMQILGTATVLFRLRDLHEEQVKGPDGMPLQDVVDLIQRIATDIQECASACDLYLNKSGFSKMLRAKDYEERFGEFIKKFDGHQRTLTLVLTARTTIVIEAMNDKLDVQAQDLKSIREKTEHIFRMLDTTREKEVQAYILAKNGAKACVESDVILQELAERSGESLESLVPTHSGKGDSGSTKRLLEDARKVLNKELAEDVDQAFKKHMEDFERKLKAQENQLTKQLTVVIDSTGKHIVSEVIVGLSGGLHTRIKDPHLKKLWEQEKWKGSVHARDFVLALHGYFASELEQPRPVKTVVNLTAQSPPVSPTSSVGEYPLHEGEKHEGDQWALAYINLAHLQPLLDVIDTDGSGWINIAEANHFARLRPKSWSLILWFAFWAAGWQLTVTWYRYKIYSILIAMLRLVHRVKPANIQAANTYFASWEIYNVELLLRTTRSAEPEYVYEDDTQLKNLARQFHKWEEAKLKSQLEQLRYKLDSIDTLQLVTGAQSSGLRRIEVRVYPLLYLLLQRHLAIMQLACVHNLHVDEFPTMNISLSTIFEAVNYRMDRLAVMFKSNVKDGQESFRYFAFGMFAQLYRDRGCDGRDIVHNTIHDRQNEEDDGLEDSDYHNPGLGDHEHEVPPIAFSKDILLNKVSDEPLQLYNPETPLSPANVTESNGALDGTWTGQLFFPDDSVPYGTISMQLIRTGDDFNGLAENSTGLLKVTGTIARDNLLRFTFTWPEGTGYRVECKGPYAAWADTITGFWEPKTEDSPEALDRTNNSSTGPRWSLRFVFRRPPATDGLARARWKVAIAAAINMVGSTALRKARARRQCSWLVERLAERKRFIDLTKREMAGRQNLSTPWLDDEEVTELQLLKIELRPCDARVYTSLAKSELQQLVAHNCFCDVCHRSIRGPRRFCVQCIDDKYDNGIDFCSECHEKTPVVAPESPFTHTSSHTVVKTIRRIHDGDKARIVPKAKLVADQVKERFRAAQAPTSHLDGPPQPSRYVTALELQVPQQFFCCYCEKPISLPCWVCLECDADTYICLACDAKGLALGHCGPACYTTEMRNKDGSIELKVIPPKHNPGCCPLAARLNPKHELFHVLVQAIDTESVAESQVMNVTLAQVMTKLVEMERKIAAVDEKLQGYLSQTAQRDPGSVSKE